jgi:hypothetical protein
MRGSRKGKGMKRWKKDKRDPSIFRNASWKWQK